MLSLLNTLVCLITCVFIFYYCEISYLHGLVLWTLFCLIQSFLTFKYLNQKWQLGLITYVLVAFTWSHLFYQLNQRYIDENPITVDATILLTKPVTAYEFQKVSEAIVQYEYLDQTYSKKIKISASRNMHFPSNCVFMGQIKLQRLRSTNNRFIYDGLKWSFIDQLHARGKLLQVYSTCKIQKVTLRDRILNRIISMQNLNEDAKSILIAVLFGDQSHLDFEVKSLFIETQTIHLMVVSGLHIGVCAWLAWIMGSLIYKLVPVKLWHYHSRKYNLIVTKNHIQIFCSFSLVLFYGYLAQFNPPALRAILMLLLPLSLWLFNKKLRLGLIWVYSLIALVMIMPAQVLSIGFWLSVISVSGLISFFTIRRQSKIEKPSLWSKFIQFFRQLIKTQWVILLVMTPLICFMGANLHGFSFIINLVLVPLITLILVPVGLCLIFLDFHFLQSFVNVICQFALFFISQFKGIGSMSFHINLFQLILIESAVFIYFFSIQYRWIFIVLFTFLALLYSFKPIKEKEFNVTILDVGQGQSVIIQTKNTQWIVDVGPGFNRQINTVRRTVIPYLKQHHSKKRFLVLSHDDRDHVFEFEQIFDYFKIDKIYSGQPKRIDYESSNCRNESKIVIDQIKFQFIAVNNFAASNDNDFSCVLLVKSEYGSILISGDLSKKGEYFLAQNNHSMDLDFVVIGHHGSNSSTSQKWLEFTNAKYAIVSRGLDSQFGHPHPHVLSRLKQSNIELLDTAVSGQISLDFKETNFQIQKDKNRLSY